jgi:cytidylate kinase
LVVAIDGPVAAGKTTVANRLADQLGFSLLDTGAIYRSVAFRCSQEQIEFNDGLKVAVVARDLPIEFRHDGRSNRILLAGIDVSETIRTSEISEGASIVSAIPAVRDALLDLQRDLGSRGNVIAEGRDIGTVVFPDARLKFFLTADPKVRALRRYRELVARGESASLEEVLVALRARDARDSSRPVAPLAMAEDAVEVDTTNLDLDQVMDLLSRRIHKELAELE